LFQATGHMRQAAAAQGIRAAVFAIVVIALVRGPSDLLAVGWAEVAAAVAVGAYCAAAQHGAITPLRLRAPAAGFIDLAREGALVGVAALLGVAIQYAPLFLVAAFAGGQQTAWFAAANRLVTALITFGYIYYFGLYPAMAWATARDRDELARLMA